MIKEREALERAEDIQKRQQQSAKQLEIRRQLAAEKLRIDILKQRAATSSASGGAAASSASSGANRSSAASIGDHLRFSNPAPPAAFQSSYGGPNINQIRKTAGLRHTVEKVVDSVRNDVPSLGHRPSAAYQPVKHVTRGNQNCAAPTNTAYKEFEEFLAWKSSLSGSGAAAASQALESDSDADSPPRGPVRRVQVPSTHYPSQIHQAVRRMITWSWCIGETSMGENTGLGNLLQKFLHRL